jgi:hypothetical protein
MRPVRGQNTVRIGLRMEVEYASMVLAFLGLAVGVRFRFKVLMPMLPLVVVASVIFAATNGYSFAQTVVTVVAAQIILQVCYFVGIATRAIFSGSQRTKLLY